MRPRRNRTKAGRRRPKNRRTNKKLASHSTVWTSAKEAFPLTASEPFTVRIGAVVAQQCSGIDPKSGRSPHPYDEPILGISDMAQLPYCEIKATIAQLASQPGYLASVAVDDGSGGVTKSPGRKLSRAERTALEGLLREKASSGKRDWETRRAVGKAAETLELSENHTERRHFTCGEFLLLGIPDAFTTDQVTEFASSRFPHFSARDKRLQANVYAILWNTPRYRVIAVHPETDQRVVLNETPDTVLAEQTISKMWSLVSGQSAPGPPNNLRKCAGCVYNSAQGCPYPNQHRVPTHNEMKSIGRPPRLVRAESKTRADLNAG